MNQELKTIVFGIFNDWIKKSGYQWTKKFTKKELWKMFVEKSQKCGIINIWKCKDYIKVRQLLGLGYTDEDGIYHGEFYTLEDFRFDPEICDQVERMIKNEKKK